MVNKMVNSLLRILSKGARTSEDGVQNVLLTTYCSNQFRKSTINCDGMYIDNESTY